MQLGISLGVNRRHSNAGSAAPAFSPAALTLHPSRWDGIVFGDHASWASAKTALLSTFTSSIMSDSGAALDPVVQLDGKDTLKLGEANRIRMLRSITPRTVYVRSIFRLSPTHIAGKQYYTTRPSGWTQGWYLPAIEYVTASGIIRHYSGAYQTDSYPLASFRGNWQTLLAKFDWDGGTGGIPLTKYWLNPTPETPNLIGSHDYTDDVADPSRHMDNVVLELGGSQVAGTDAVNNYSHYHLVEMIDGDANPAPYGPTFV